MLKRISESPVLLSIITIILGLVLIVWPNPVLELVIKVIGVCLLVSGVISVIGWWRHRDAGFNLYGRLALGIVSIIAGIVVLADPVGVASLFPVLMGIGILVNGLINGAKALDLKSLGYPRWPALAVMAVITIVVGLIFILRPDVVLTYQVVLAGLALIYDGITSLWIMTRSV